MANNKSSSAIVKDLLDNNLSKYLEENPDLFNDKEESENLKQIKERILKLQNIFENIKNSNITKSKSRYYSKNIGVDFDNLSYIISKEDKNFNVNVQEAYMTLNEIANLLKLENEERDYNIYYYSEKTGQYYMKKISHDQINQYTKASKNSKKGLTSSRLGPLRKELKNFSEEHNEYKQAQINFSSHLTNFMSVLQSGLKRDFKQGEKGYAYELFEYHMRNYNDTIKYNKDGMLIDFTPHGVFNSTSDGQNLAKAFHAQIGNSRWVTEGDIGLTQIKSITDSGGFSVSSLEQIENTFNVIAKAFLNGDGSFKEKLNINDIENLVLFFNDFHKTVGDEITEEAKEDVFNRVKNILTGIKGIKIE